VNLNDIIKEKNMTKYLLSKTSGVPFSTISDISTGKTKIEKCSAETLYKLAKALRVTMEELVEDVLAYRSSFETFKSNVCHMVKDMGDMDFIIYILENSWIRRMYRRRWFPESLYLLAMLDYLSRENNMPLCKEFDDLRKLKLRDTIYPASILAMTAVSHSDKWERQSYKNAIPEFRKFNIIEAEVRNVV
jgi:transcriptional regulator with XRE-family HTH domain